MGTSFSALDKHGGCYNFGVNLGSKTPSRRNPNQWFSSTVLPSSVQSACNTCRTLAPGVVSSGCGRGLQPADPGCSGPHCPFGVSSWLHADPSSGNSNQGQQPISGLHSTSVPSSVQSSTRTPRRTSTTQPRISLSSQTGTALEDTVIVREPVLGSFDDVDQSRLGENRKNVTAASDTVPVRKQRTIQNRKLTHYLYRKTDVKEATWVYVSHFSSLLQLWSFDELYQLQNQFEALELLKEITVAANEARSKAPTLDEDLRALCSSGWCNNMQVSYGHVVRGAHSYILSARSHVFSKVLHAVYRSLFNKSRSTSLLPIMSILVPNLDDEDNLLDTSHSNATPDPFRNSPDVLRSTSIDSCQQCVRCQEPRLRGDSSLSTQSSVEPQLEQRSRRDHKSSQSVLFEHAVFDFLMDLYAGHNRNSFNLFLEEPNHRHYSPTKPKPDLLCLPEAPARLHSANSGNDLLCLYRVIDSTHPESPLAPDCRLTFSCEHSPPCYEMLHVKCHAGLLAARSQFLRRLLLRRYVAQVGEGGNLTSVVFDGRLIKPYFAHLLVQFFYSDRLDLNAIAAVAQPRKTHGSTAVNSSSGSGSEHSCRLVSESAQMQHTEWHATHTGGCGTRARRLPCCVGYLEDDASCPTLDPYNRTASSFSGHGGCLASPHVSAQQHIKFCLSCPYCLACVLELHPVGHYLEFPRLTEACEDLVVRALRLPFRTSLKDPDLPSDFSDQGSHERTRYIRVTPISLAVGLLRWADSAFNRPSPTSSSVESVVIQQNSADTRQERSSSANTNEPRLPATDMSVKSSDIFRSPETQSEDRSTTTRYLYLQAVQSLRDNFMFLVRTPQVLGRLTPKQLREVLDSSLVQAPESEILAALLCWSEQRIRYAQDKGTSDGSRLSAYTSLVSIISEQPDRAYCSRSREINPWLLLGLNQSDEFSRSIELVAQDLPLRQTSSAECDLCHAMDERNNQSQDIIGFDPVDLEVLVKKLHQHRLLETLRPTHLLTPVPLGLATVILQHHLGVTKKSSLSSESLLTSSAHLPNNSPLLGLDAVDPIQFYHWAPLLTTSMMLLRHSSSTREQPTTLHPILSLKLGNGPLSVLPPSSPAQVSPRNAWLSITQSVNHVVSLRRFRVPCYCRWSTNADLKDNVKGSGSDSSSPKLASNLQPDRSPRLFYPFFNEVRVILTSRSLSSTPVRNPPVGHESRCTCLRLLSTLSAQCTPTHVPLTAIQRNDSFPVPNGYNHQQSVSNCEATITVSPQKGGHGDTESVTATREPCCSSKCADFAHCLLQPHQWTNLITRYLQLVEEFASRHANPWLRLDANHVCLLYRLQVLREQGLPDDLHTLLACRINEHLCELSQDVADLSSEVTVDRQTLDIISSTVSASKHAGINLPHFSTGSYESADASSFSITPEKDTSPLIPEDAASVSVTAREKHSHRVNASLHPYIETKNEPVESHKCLACQTAGQPFTLLDYSADSRHPFPKPRSSPSARLTQPNTTSHGVRKNSNSTLPCLCDNLPYPTYTLSGFGAYIDRGDRSVSQNLVLRHLCCWYLSVEHNRASGALLIQRMSL
ncbi:hypothetical protein CLF_106832 [Clonorchis sinensis]|uniref:BTB domain-containing protein n=1 Tax=Clonorchis sinensis TaxID=79923 RepID=G7YFT4_CLOSI|nr:hypothetical protein CLF_106832 [Clonorchis sinensis]